jgi:threonine/homoserine/homoserine lactone efflux protein
MNTLLLLLQGIILGLSIAAPVGPIGILCIRRTLVAGRLAGFVLGLGAATADMLYGAVAAFGLGMISSLLVGESLWIHVVGACFLGWLGIRTILTPPAAPSKVAVAATGLVGSYVTTLLLTLTNPTTILSFIAIFAGIGVVGTRSGAPVSAGAGLTVLGIFCGSALWWLTLSGIVNMVRSRFTPEVMRWVNYLSGAILIGFALFAVLTLVISF